MTAKRNGNSIRLAAGRHPSPRSGVCVVELASLIAGEEFSDRPRCVCPVIAAFLRGWNDRAGYAERQRLAPYAARIVGTRGDRRLTRRRREVCIAWAGVDPRHGRTRRLWSRMTIGARIAALYGARAVLRPGEAVGDYAARLAFENTDTERGLGLLEALLAIEAGPRPAQISGNGHGSVTGNGLPAPTGNGLPAPAVSGNGSVTGSGEDARVPAPETQPALSVGTDGDPETPAS